MRLLLGLVSVSLLLSVSLVSVYAVSDLKQAIGKKNKFRERQAGDDTLAYPNLDEDSLLNTKCPHNLELRWQTEVSSSIYATPLIADINSDGKLEVVVPSFVHYLEVLEGSDGDKFPGWPAFHQSMVHSSPLLFDIDKDGTKEIALATFNGIIHFFRSSGYLMMDKLEVPRRKVRKDWYVGLRPDPVDRSRPDVHDDLIVKGASGVTENKSKASSLPKQSSNSSKTSAKEYEELISTRINSESQHIGQVNSQDNNTTVHNVLLENIGTENKTLQVLLKSSENFNSSTHNVSFGNITSENSTQRRLLQDSGQQGIFESQDNDGIESHEATVKNDGNLEEDADQSFDLFRGAEDLSDEYNYDYDDYVDESLWGDEEWTEEKHEKLEDYVNVDSHILCTPVIADIDNDGVQEMIVSATYFFDREYYDNPEHLAELGGIDVGNYVASSIVVFNLDTKQVKWTAELDLSTDSGNFRAYVYTSPTVIDLDGDGNLDILVGTSYGLVYALDHRGKVRTNFPLEMAEIQSQVVAADINDDGKIEILTSDAHGNVAAWTAQGEEIWEAHIKSLIPQGPTIGDVDGDGHTDVVIPTISGNIYVLSGRDGSFVRPFPYRTRGRVMNRVLLVDLSKRGEKKKGLTLVTTSFDGYLYLIDGSTACTDVVDIGETSYSMVLADNIDGGDDLDLVVSTMNGNVYCFSTSSPHHPLKEWRSSSQGRNNPGVRYEREGVYISQSSRSFRDEEGKYFWVEFEIIDKYRVPSGFQGPYNVTMNLLVPGNYQGERRIVFHQMYNEPGKQRMKLPTVPVRTTGTVFLEMVDRNGVYFYDEFSLTFHMHYYKLLKWLLFLPLLGMFGILVILRPYEGSPLPSYSRNRD